MMNYLRSLINDITPAFLLHFCPDRHSISLQLEEPLEVVGDSDMILLTVEVGRKEVRSSSL